LLQEWLFKTIIIALESLYFIFVPLYRSNRHAAAVFYSFLVFWEVATDSFVLPVYTVFHTDAMEYRQLCYRHRSVDIGHVDYEKSHPLLMPMAISNKSRP